MGKKSRKAAAQLIAVAPEPKRMRISAEATFQAGPQAQRNPFIIPPPLPGTVPAGKKLMATDSAIKAVSEWALAQDSFGSNLNVFPANGVFGYGGGLYGVQAFQGYPYLAELAQRPEYRRGVEIIAKEMTRKWIRIHSKSGDGDKNDYIAKLGDALEKFRVQDVFREAAEHDGFFGRGQIYIDTGVGENPAELSKPLLVDKAKVRKGSLRRLKAIEPLWSYPGVYNASDPLHEHFYSPETWWVQSREIHSSRLLGMVSREVPDLLKPAYLFGGLSLTQMAEPYVNNWIRTRSSVGDLVNAFSTMVLSTDMGSTLGGDAGTNLLARVEMFNRFRSNRGTFVVDKATEELANVAAPLGGLDHLQAQSQEHMSAVYGIPLVKFFGITPSGLNASSDGEMRAYYEWIGALQEHAFRTPLARIIDIIQLSEFGSVDDSITFSFEPLWELTDVELSTVRKNNADTAAVYIADGVLAPEEERARLAAEEDGQYDGLDLSIQPEPPMNALEPKIGPGEKEDGDPDAPETEGAHGTPGTQPADDIAAVSMNGAQVTSLIDVVAQVNAGTLSRESALVILTTAFPIDQQHADKILGKPMPPPKAPVASAGQPPGTAEQEPQTAKPEPKPPAPKPADPKATASKSPS